jgi:hypothetical protein
VRVRRQVVVDDPEAAAFPFAAASIRPPEFAEPAAPRDDIAGLWIARKVKLQFAVVIGAQIGRKDLREERRLDELDEDKYTLLAYALLWVQEDP